MRTKSQFDQTCYASGGSSSNQVRHTSLTYPNGRAIDYDYGSGGGMNDRLNRISALKDGGTSLAAYTYLGGGTVVRIDYAQPGVRLDLWGGTTTVFAGFDAFGRVIDQRWVTTGGTDKDRYKYGYDENSNRQWRQNTTATDLDEYYTYDNLNRLVTMKRGTLSGGPPPTGITSPVAQQDWTLDETGNWNAFVVEAGGTPTLEQTRTANEVNEIQTIDATTGDDWADPAWQ